MFLLVAALAGCQDPVSAPEPARSPENVVAAPLDGRTGAFLTVHDAASRVRVVLAALPGQLYRISTPAGSGLVPSVTTRGSRVRAWLRPTGGDGPDEVVIVLNREVRWDISLPAGAGEQQLDLSRGRVRSLVTGPSGLLELRLPRAAGTVPVTLSGSLGTAVVAHSGAPIRLRLDEGAGSVTGTVPDGVAVPGGDASAVTAGTVLVSREWTSARDRFVVCARSAVGSLVLRRFSPAAR